MQSRLCLFVALVCFIVPFVQAQAPEAGDDSWVPDMIGAWTLEGASYMFSNVIDPDSEPEYLEITAQPCGTDEGCFYITDQIGRVFAGSWGEDPARKLTGVIMPDRTVSIQVFETSEFRGFITGKLTRSGSTLQITGYMHSFDDLSHLDGGAWTMGTGYGRFVKVN